MDFTDEETESENLSNLSNVIQMVNASEVRVALGCSTFYQIIGNIYIHTYTCVCINIYM